MFPIDDYAEFQRREIQLLKKAEIERQAREMKKDGSEVPGLWSAIAFWLGLHLITWGQKLKYTSASHHRQRTAPLSSRSSSL